MSVRLCCVSVIGLCYILCILQHFVQGGRFFRTRCTFQRCKLIDYVDSYGVPRLEGDKQGRGGENKLFSS